MKKKETDYTNFFYVNHDLQFFDGELIEPMPREFVNPLLEATKDMTLNETIEYLCSLDKRGGGQIL